MKGKGEEERGREVMLEWTNERNGKGIWQKGGKEIVTKGY
jgi:hypothetical protein